jgi:hypothetical protein
LIDESLGAQMMIRLKSTCIAMIIIVLLSRYSWSQSVLGETRAILNFAFFAKADFCQKFSRMVYPELYKYNIRMDELYEELILKKTIYYQKQGILSICFYG